MPLNTYVDGYRAVAPVNVNTVLGPIFDGAFDAITHARNEGWLVTQLPRDVIVNGHYVLLAAAPHEVPLVLAWSNSGSIKCWWTRTVTR